MKERYERLKVLELLDNDKIKCLCDCGHVVVVKKQSLKSGNTKSCGCIRTESITKHGLWKHPLYNTWKSMKNRCNNPNDKDYDKYGGRGIDMNPVWLDVRVYIKDMESILGEKPKGMTVDRIDNDKGYYIDNLRYASTSQQNLNKRYAFGKLGEDYRNIYEKNKKGYVSYEIRMKRRKVERMASSPSLETAVKIRDEWLKEYENNDSDWVARTKNKEYRNDVKIWKKG